MRISKKLDYALVTFAIVSISLLFAALYSMVVSDTFADSEDGGLILATESHFVTIYDEGKKLIIKTSAGTVRDCLERANVVLNSTDTVEPGLDEEIKAGDFFINIYRSRPVIVRDGATEKYLMTSSYDPKTIAKEAGITVYDGDKVDVSVNDMFLEVGVANIYQITRNGGHTITVETEIPYEEETIKEYNTLPVGATEIRQIGEVGTRTSVYEVYYVDGQEISRELISEEVTKEPVTRIVAVGASEIERHPLTASMGRNYYTVTKEDGTIIERQETFYDLDMSRVMQYRLADGCGDGTYSVREDGVKIDNEGYVLVAANLDRYPLCSVVETSLGMGRVYDTGSFATKNPEQFDIATDWTNQNGR